MVSEKEKMMMILLCIRSIAKGQKQKRRTPKLARRNGGI